MKKILITCWAMEIGGVERSLLGLLNALDYKQYQIDLFLCRHEGDFMDQIPKQVNLLPELKAYTMFQKPIGENFRKGCLGIGAIRCLTKAKVSIQSRFGKKGIDSLLACYCKSSLGLLPQLSKENYDMALSFLTPHYFARYKAKAKKHIAWIHTDYTALEVNQQMESKMWGAYDFIAGVSTQCVEAFAKVFPEHREKLIEIENILSTQLVRNEAKQEVLTEMPDEEGITKICTVGRFSTAKAFDNAVKLCNLLIEQGCKVKWYAVGYGGDEPMIRELIRQYQLEEKFIILGKKTNPYPYMSACDIYIQPSRYEGKAVAVREAQMLGKPVIITNFETAPSQLEEGVDGIIAPMEIEACARAIQSVIENQKLREKLVQNMAQREYGNEQEVEKIYALI